MYCIISQLKTLHQLPFSLQKSRSLQRPTKFLVVLLFAVLLTISCYSAPYIIHSCHFGLLAVLEHAKHTSVTGPFYVLFPLPGILFPQISTCLTSSLSARVSSNLPLIEKFSSILPHPPAAPFVPTPDLLFSTGA